MPVTEFPRPTPINVLGDSHSFAFSDRVFADESGATYVFRALFCPGVTTRTMVGPDGRPDPRLITALEAARVLARGANGIEATHRSADPLWQWARAIEGRLDLGQPVVITTGGLDLIEVGTVIAKEDFTLPPAVLDDPATPADCKEVFPGALGAQETARIFASPLPPLRMLLRFLRGLGISRLAVLGLAPLTTDDVAYERALNALAIPIPPGQLHPRFRRKLVVGMNFMLRTLCEEEGVPFVDRWSTMTHGGVPLPGIMLDMTHVTPEAAAATAEDIIALFGSRAAGDEPPSPEVVALAASRHALRNGTPPDDVVFAGDGAPPGSRDAALYMLTAVAPAMHVLEIGGGNDTLGRLFEADGATVTALRGTEDVEAHAASNGPASFDLVLAYNATDGLTLREIDRFYAAVAQLLLPDGALLLQAPRHPYRVRYEDRPMTMLRGLRAHFPHVAAWAATADEPAGTLARYFQPDELQHADAFLAFASHRPLDADEIVRRMTVLDPLPDLGASVVLRDPIVPATVAAGEAFVATVTLANASSELLASIGATPVFFAALWWEAGVAAEGDLAARSPLAIPSLPGSTRTYAVRIVPPSKPGNYGLRISLIQEHVRWFDTAVDAVVRVE